jgi:hypothetical protein
MEIMVGLEILKHFLLFFPVLGVLHTQREPFNALQAFGLGLAAMDL